MSGFAPVQVLFWPLLSPLVQSLPLCLLRHSRWSLPAGLSLVVLRSALPLSLAFGCWLVGSGSADDQPASCAGVRGPVLPCPTSSPSRSPRALPSACPLLCESGAPVVPPTAAMITLMTVMCAHCLVSAQARTQGGASPGAGAHTDGTCSSHRQPTRDCTGTTGEPTGNESENAGCYCQAGSPPTTRQPSGAGNNPNANRLPKHPLRGGRFRHRAVAPVCSLQIDFFTN